MTFHCDDCGRFVAYRDLDSGSASHRMLTPDSAYTFEEWETLCPKHAAPSVIGAPETNNPTENEGDRHGSNE